MKYVELHEIIGERIKMTLREDLTPEQRQQENEQTALVIGLAKQDINLGDLILRTEKLMAQCKTLEESVAYDMIK